MYTGVWNEKNAFVYAFKLSIVSNKFPLKNDLKPSDRRQNFC